MCNAYDLVDNNKTLHSNSLHKTLEIDNIYKSNEPRSNFKEKYVGCTEIYLFAFALFIDQQIIK